MKPQQEKSLEKSEGVQESFTPQKATLRQSNIELLRIVSMFMILLVHFDGATFDIPNYLSISDLGNLNTMAKVAIESFAIIGVNCFVLISGYFGIKFTIKGLVNFVLWVAFYSIAIGILEILLKPNSNYLQELGNMFGIFSQTDLWFVPAYFALYIFAPVLNKALNKFTKTEYIFLLLGLTFLNIYLGWWHNGSINDHGYNVMQMIFIYSIGRFLGRFSSRFPQSSNKRHFYTISYIVSFLCIVCSSFCLPFLQVYAYNSLFVVCASIFFFLIFTTVQFQNRFINYVAISAFAVYLIHKNPPVWSTLKKFVYNQSIEMPQLEFVLFWIAFIIVLFAVCIIIDKVRLKMTNPITTIITSHITKLVSYFGH